MEIVEILKKYGSKTDPQLFERLADIILEWNEKINVTAVRDRKEFMEKNVADSLELLAVPEFSTAERILDLGTGGGFPGLPLAAACPEKRFVLADAVGKKLKVVADAAERLGLENVSVMHARAEDMGRDPSLRESFDLVTARAVAAMPVLAEYCLPFARVGGCFAAFKTAASAEEIEGAAGALKKLGGGEPVLIPSGSEGSGHLIAVVPKLSRTPDKYPRKAGTPSRDPLK